MKSKMILGQKETSPYMPDAGELQFYGGLRVPEKGGIEFSPLGMNYSAEWMRVWQEDNLIYASVCLDYVLTEEMDAEMADYETKRRNHAGTDYIIISPVYMENIGMIFFEYSLLKTLKQPNGSYIVEFSADKNNVHRLEKGQLYSETDYRKLYRDTRKYSQASHNYMYNLLYEGSPILPRKNQKSGEDVLPDNEYQEILARDDKIATRTYEEMVNSNLGSDMDYLAEAYNALRIYKGARDPYKELGEVEGLEEIKENVSTLARKLKYYKERKARGKINNTSTNMHMCFMGSPGTGKTTLARIMVGILYEMGIIEHNEFVEIAATDLKAKYSNQTAKKTEMVIRSAYGRVLFIDEAYALASDEKEDYGREAINEILKQMEDNRDKLIIIFAGYKADMEKFLDMNIGFRSRINRYYEFKDFSAFECTEMVLRKFESVYSFTREAVYQLFRYFEQAKGNRNFGNVRTVKMVCHEMVRNWACRTSYGQVAEDRKYIIEKEDILGI